MSSSSIYVFCNCLIESTAFWNNYIDNLFPTIHNALYYIWQASKTLYVRLSHFERASHSLSHCNTLKTCNKIDRLERSVTLVRSIVNCTRYVNFYSNFECHFSRSSGGVGAFSTSLDTRINGRLKLSSWMIHKIHKNACNTKTLWCKFKKLVLYI